MGNSFNIFYNKKEKKIQEIALLEDSIYTQLLFLKKAGNLCKRLRHRWKNKAFSQKKKTQENAHIKKYIFAPGMTLIKRKQPSV